jgi:crotonobetainyl-CoA:carnitine CoA-transferase CaiB-like acyl-CoA transferase
MRVDEVRNPERGSWGKPLEGVRILAAEQMQALPYATQLMAHLGADVIKVEHPRNGESGRGARPTLVDTDGREVGATYLRNNLNKQSIGIDLKSAGGVALFRRLASEVDVVAENFRPGTMDRLGLGYASFAESAPRLIYVSVSGFGNLDESPYASWPAYAPIPEAMAGFYEQNRRDDERPRALVAGALGDIGSGMFAVIGTLSALRHRERTGLGQHVDIAMFDAMVAMADMVPFMASMDAPRISSGGPWIIDSFRAKDGYFVLEIIRDNHLHDLARAIGRPEWIGDERFADRARWPEFIEPIFRPAIEHWAAEHTKLEACHLLAEHGVAAGPSNTAEDLRADPHVALRNMLIEVPRPDAEKPLQIVGNPVKMSRLAEGPVRRFPLLGEHTDRVLRELLGVADDELAALRAEGTI